MADEHYDAIVIGTSQGGRFLPIELAKEGQQVALVERDQLGGVCVNRGCTPTKTMVASARLAYLARRGAEYGVRTGPVTVDLAAVRERKRAMVAGAREGHLRQPPAGRCSGGWPSGRRARPSVLQQRSVAGGRRRASPLPLVFRQSHKTPSSSPLKRHFA